MVPIYHTFTYIHYACAKKSVYCSVYELQDSAW